MTRKEYRKIVWGLLKDFRDDEKMTLVELLNKIMAIGIPDKKGKKTDNSRFVVHGTYFPHNNKKKVLE